MPSMIATAASAPVAPTIGRAVSHTATNATITSTWAERVERGVGAEQPVDDLASHHGSGGSLS